MFLIVGRRNKFDVIHLKSGQKEIKKLNAKIFNPLERFGLSEKCEGEAGERIFQVRIYEVKEKGSIIIMADGDGKDVEVFLVNAEEKKIRMTPIDCKVYDESKKRDNITTILDFLKPIGRIINGIGRIVGGGK